jgi:hypothetical protein
MIVAGVKRQAAGAGAGAKKKQVVMGHATLPLLAAGNIATV